MNLNIFFLCVFVFCFYVSDGQIVLVNGQYGISGEALTQELNIYSSDRGRCFAPTEPGQVVFRHEDGLFSFSPDSMYYSSRNSALNLVIDKVPDQAGKYHVFLEKEQECLVRAESYFSVNKGKPTDLSFHSFSVSALPGYLKSIGGGYRNNAYVAAIWFSSRDWKRCESFQSHNVSVRHGESTYRVNIDSLSLNESDNNLRIYFTIPNNAPLGSYELVLLEREPCENRIRDILKVQSYKVDAGKYTISKYDNTKIFQYYYGPSEFTMICEDGVNLQDAVLRHLLTGKEEVLNVKDSIQKKRIHLTPDFSLDAPWGEYEIVFKNSCLAPYASVTLAPQTLNTRFPNTLEPGKPTVLAISDEAGFGALAGCLEPDKNQYELRMSDGLVVSIDSLMLFPPEKPDRYNIHFTTPLNYNYDTTIRVRITDAKGCYQEQNISTKPVDYLFFSTGFLTPTYVVGRQVEVQMWGDALQHSCLDMNSEYMAFVNGDFSILVDSLEMKQSGVQVYYVARITIPDDAPVGRYELDIGTLARDCYGRVRSAVKFDVIRPRIEIQGWVDLFPGESASFPMTIRDSNMRDSASCEARWKETIRLVSVSDGTVYSPDTVYYTSSSPNYMSVFIDGHQGLVPGIYKLQVDDNCLYDFDTNIEVRRGGFSALSIHANRGQTVTGSITASASFTKTIPKDSLVFVHAVNGYEIKLDMRGILQYSVTIPMNAPSGTYHLINKDSSEASFSILRNVLTVNRTFVQFEHDAASLQILSSGAVTFTMINAKEGMNLQDPGFCLNPVNAEPVLSSYNGDRIRADSIITSSPTVFTAYYTLDEDVSIGNYTFRMSNENCSGSSLRSVNVGYPNIYNYYHKYDTSHNVCDNKKIVRLFFDQIGTHRIDTLDIYNFSKNNTRLYLKRRNLDLVPDSVFFNNSTLTAIFTLPEPEASEDEMFFSTGEKIKIKLSGVSSWLLEKPKIASPPIVLKKGEKQIIGLTRKNMAIDMEMVLWSHQVTGTPEIVMEHESKTSSFSIQNFIPIGNRYAQVSILTPDDALAGFYYPVFRYPFCDVRADIAAVSVKENNTSLQLSSGSIARAGNVIKLIASYYNSGAKPVQDARLWFVLGEHLHLLADFQSLFTKSGDTLLYSLPEMIPGKNYTFSFQIKIDTLVQGGDTVLVTGGMDVKGEQDISDNYAEWMEEIRASFDPNDKLVDKSEIDEADKKKNLIYTIRFQNTGNDTAFVVRIEDQLPVELDWTTLKVLTHSHPMDYKFVSNGVLEFLFRNILLPDSTTDEANSHGYVSFSIKLKEGMLLAPGDSVANQAAIFFDYNAPIITNYAVTKLIEKKDIVNSVAEVFNWNFEIFPNPARSGFSIKSPERGQLFLYTASGVLSLELTLNPGINEILVPSELEKGLYLYRIQTEKYSGRGKILLVK